MEIQQPDPNESPRKFNIKAFFLKGFSNLLNLVLGILRRIIGFFQRRLHLKKTIIVFVTIILVLILRSIFFPAAKQIKDKDIAQSQEEDLVPVKVFKVCRFNFEDSLNSLGTIKG